MVLQDQVWGMHIRIVLLAESLATLRERLLVSAGNPTILPGTDVIGDVHVALKSAMPSRVTWRPPRRICLSCDHFNLGRYLSRGRFSLGIVKGFEMNHLRCLSRTQ